MTYFIGLDISKKSLDVCVLETKESCTFHQFPNTASGHQALLVFLHDIPVSLVVCEPTGGYELAVCQALYQANLPIHRVHTLLFHGFAKSMGIYKNDKIDSYKLAYYGKTMEKKKNFSVSDTGLENLVKRREYLVLQLSNEKRHIQQKADGHIMASIQDHISYLKEAIHKLDLEIETHIQNNPDQKNKHNLLCSIPGIGKILAYKFLATMPELGDAAYDLNQLSALVGVAPYCRDSGTSQGRRFIRGGRQIPRDALYVAALTGFRKIPLLRDLRERLIRKGKPCKVALVACMRKLLCIIHSVLKRKENFVTTRA